MECSRIMIARRSVCLLFVFCLFVCLSVCLFVCLSVCLFVCLFVYLSVVYLSVCLFVCLFVYLTGVDVAYNLRFALRSVCACFKQNNLRTHHHLVY